MRRREKERREENRRRKNEPFAVVALRILWIQSDGLGCISDSTWNRNARGSECEILRGVEKSYPVGRVTSDARQLFVTQNVPAKFFS